MLDALVGAVMVVVATTSLVLAVEVMERSFGSAGRQPLNTHEQELLQIAGRGDDESLRLLKADLEGLPRQMEP